MSRARTVASVIKGLPHEPRERTERTERQPAQVTTKVVVQAVP